MKYIKIFSVVLFIGFGSLAMEIASASHQVTYNFDDNNRYLLEDAIAYDIEEKIDSPLRAFAVSNRNEENYDFLHLFYQATKCSELTEKTKQILLAQCLPQSDDLILNYPKELQRSLRSTANVDKDLWPIFTKIAEHILVVFRQNMGPFYKEIADIYLKLARQKEELREVRKPARKKSTSRLQRSKSHNVDSSKLKVTTKESPTVVNKAENCCIF